MKKTRKKCELELLIEKLRLQAERANGASRGEFAVTGQRKDQLKRVKEINSET